MKWSALRHYWKILVETAKNWIDNDPFRQSAIIAYYAIFSIPGLLMIVIWIAGAFFGVEAIRGEISGQVSSVMGAEVAEGVQDLLVNAELNKSNVWMKIVGIATLVFGATTLFFQLQKSLNHIWEVEADPRSGIKKLLVDRASSLGLIIVIAFLLLITLILSTLISLVGNWIEYNFGEYLLHFVQWVNFILSLAIVSVLFAIMFKFLPDVRISWRSVWVGAVVTALLFTIGKSLLGLYFGYADPESSFGAAGTIVLVMLWVNYTCLILFFGVEFTRVFARRHEQNIKPSHFAKWSAAYRLRQSEKQKLKVA